MLVEAGKQEQSIALLRLAKKPKLQRFWRDLSLRWKITISLWLAAAVPVLIVTQFNVQYSRTNYIKNLTQSLEQKGAFFTSDFVLWSLEEAKPEAEQIAKTVEAQGVSLTNVQELAPLLQLTSNVEPESIKNFKLIVNRQGQVVAGVAQTIDDRFVDNPPLVAKDQVYRPAYRVLSIPSGVPLGDLEILRATLTTGQPQSGMELVRSSILQKLGLAEQARITPRPQKIAGLKPEEAPFPEGKFDVENGKTGLVSIATHPIQQGNSVVGVVVIGSLLNRNYGIVDVFQAKNDVPVATIFAQDFRVNTSIPYIDPSTGKPDGSRAIGTRVSREVAEKVLLEGKKFVGETNIVGQFYLTYYEPLFNHKQQPVGISFIGTSRREVDAALRTALLQSYGIGVITLIALAFLGAYVANSIVTPIQQLASFASLAGKGQLRKLDTDRADEIGQLAESINQMVENIENSIAAQLEEVQRSMQLKEEAERLAQEQRQQKELLQKRALELLLEVDPVSRGDLTVRAKVTEDELGTIADAYNSLIRSLRELVLGVKESATTVTQSTIANDQMVKTVATGAKQQVEALQEALQQVAVMAESLQEVEQRAQIAQSQVNEAVAVVAEGDKVMTRTVAEINVAREKVTKAAEKVQLLESASQKIAKVVKLIGNFAAQTNLLALNASIEAARAGEEGESFKVVADEVRALAQRSTEATREIRRLLEEIQGQVNEVVSAIQEGTEQVAESTELIEQARQRLQAINAVSAEVNQLINDIAQASHLQLLNSDRVKQVMTQVATIATDNSQQAETVARTFDELLALAQRLQQQVGRFKVNS
ncbi:MAG: methyl-accepting chemotaxis protein [Pseudanabaenaceae cyanobacterium]